MTQSDNPGRSDLDAEVRRYLWERIARYAPLLGAALLLAVLVVKAPSVRPTSIQARSTLDTGTPVASDGSSGTTVAGPTAVAPIAAGSTANLPAGRQAGASSPASGSAAGTAVSGMRCAPGVRQVAWSVYAPPCLAAFHGPNGGNTSLGVSATTITVTYREEGSASDVGAVGAVLPGAIPSDPQVESDINTYLNLFNSQFELYGRKVVLKPFKAQGDFLQEIQGQDEQGAQADAATARGFNPFADITTLPSQPYQEGLIQNKIMAFGGLYMSDAWFNQHAPYAWSSTFPDDDAVAKAAVSAVCHRMAGMPAIFAGDSATQAKTRVFGLLTPENPVYSAAGDYIQAHLKSECGVVVAKRISYALDISTAQQQTTNAIAQLKSAGVTTVICGCDPVAPIYLAQAADNQSYHPEWATLWWGDPFNRAIASDQSSHGIALGTQGQSPAEATTEAYRAFKLSAPSAQPAEGDFTVVYYDLLLLFNGLQAAGPNLNPQSFQDGLDSLPPTAVGDDGSWHFGPGLHVPMSTFRITWWSPTTASGYDGKAGAYLNCEGGRWFSLSNPDVGSGQPRCFGR